ncbi:hypothetical protein KI387_020284, partial [Taxus chinensis]
MLVGSRMFLFKSWSVLDGYPFCSNLNTTAAFQFAENLKNIKLDTKLWACKKKERDEKDLIEIEEALQKWYDSEGGGFLTEEDKTQLGILEKRRRCLLDERETLWRLKSRALWLECGDENTNFFQSYAH